MTDFAVLLYNKMKWREIEDQDKYIIDLGRKLSNMKMTFEDIIVVKLKTSS